MDLEALLEIFARKYGEGGFERGRSYSIEITTEEVMKIMGEPPPSGSTVGLNVKISQEADCRHFAVVRRLQSLPGDKNNPYEK
jgi:hypothetical protein